MIAISRILVPIDFTECSTIALGYARDLARTFGAVLHLVHVVDEPDAHTRFAQTEAERSAEDRLAAMLTAEERNLGAHCAVLSSGLPAFAIVEHAKMVNADAIVIAMRDGEALLCPFLGFATERILRTAPCPVFVVRQAEREATASFDARSTAQAVTEPAAVVDTRPA